MYTLTVGTCFQPDYGRIQLNCKWWSVLGPLLLLLGRCDQRLLFKGVQCQSPHDANVDWQSVLGGLFPARNSVPTGVYNLDGLDSRHKLCIVAPARHAN
jgi:hypothetical protein